jgi:hypothetical protein
MHGHPDSGTMYPEYLQYQELFGKICRFYLDTIDNPTLAKIKKTRWVTEKDLLELLLC